MAELNVDKMAKSVVERAIQELKDNGVFVVRWIPVSERLPEEYGVYLVTIGESTDFCIWNKKEWGWESRKGWEPNIEITAWMPLPEPWKGESE